MSSGCPGGDTIVTLILIRFIQLDGAISSCHNLICCYSNALYLPKDQIYCLNLLIEQQQQKINASKESKKKATPNVNVAESMQEESYLEIEYLDQDEGNI